MKRTKLGAAVALAGLMAWAGGSARAQVASSLINQGEQLDPVNLPGWTVSGVDNPAVNGIGGWAVNLVTSNAGVTTSRIWGSVDGVAAPMVFVSEGVYDGFTQNAFEARFGFSNTGDVTYSASGTGPSGGTDSAFLNTNALAIDSEPLPPGPLADRYWVFASGPTMSASGTPYFVAGTSATSGGSTTARGLFNGTGDPVVYSAREYPNLPAPLQDTSGTPVAFSYKVSDGAHQYIAEVELETTGTGVPTTQNIAVLMSGEGLLIDGTLVQEGKLVPVSAGGNGTENWSAWDYFGINEMRDYMFTGDTSAATTADEFVVKNGQIVLREGQPAGAFNVVGDIEAGDMNESGDWAVMWDISTTIEAIVYNGVVVLKEGDAVDFTGDGIVDAGAVITDFNGFIGEGLAVGNRDASGNTAIYFSADVNDNGSGNLIGIYRLVLPGAAGTDDDLQLVVTDSPDPLTTVPGNLTYAVAVRNNGGTTKTGVVVTSTLDPSLVFNAGLSDAIATHSAGVVTANIGTMAPYEVKSYKFVVSAPTAGTVTTTTNVVANEADPVPGNNSASNDTEVGSLTDLQIVVTDTPDPLYTLNGSVLYTIQVTNDGPSNATGVVVSFVLDPSTTFNAGLSDAIASHSAGVVTANIGAMAKKTSTSFVVGVDTGVQGLLSATAVVTGGESDPFPENNEETETTLYQLTTNLAITLSDSPDPVTPTGGQITYAVEVSNAGPSDATGVVATVTLDPTTAFVSATAGAHDGAPTGGVVTLNVGALAIGGSSATLITVTTLAAGRPTALGEVAGGGFETDPSLANNSRPVSTLVFDESVGLPVAVFSTIASSPSSDVPGIPDTKFDSVGGFDRPYRSPNGKRWIISADTNLGTAVDEVVVSGSLCSAGVVVQEGVTALDLGDLVGPIDTELSINDAGQFAFATNTDAATTADEVIVQWNGSAYNTIAREGNLAGPTTFNYQADLHSPQIIANGQVWFVADTSNPDTAQDFFVLWKNGNAVLAQEGVTVPTGQAGGLLDPWQIFDTGDLSVDGAGLHYLIQGDTLAATANDDILAYDNGVVIQESIILPGSGFTSPVGSGNSVEYGRMMSNGDWLARGDNDDAQDWVVRNGGIVAYTDGPLFGGAVEFYDDAPFASGFFSFAGNNLGDYVVGSTTNASEDRSNAVVVLNQTVVIAREDDPVDLDGNGLFDEGVRIHTFGNDDAILTDDLQLYFSCTLRADGGTAEVGDAFVRVNLCDIATVCGDLDIDGDVDASDYTAFRASYGRSTCDPQYRICADFDESGVVGIADYQAWLACYRDFVQNPDAAAPTKTPVPGRIPTDHTGPVTRTPTINP